MRKVRVFAALVAVVLGVWGGLAEAAVRKFDQFSIDVPDGWKVEDDKENYTVSFTAPDDSAALTVSVTAAEGGSMEDWAKAYQEELKGKNLQKFSENGYMFEFENENGVGCRATVSGDSKRTVLLVAIGEHAAFEKMLNSLED
ncbi:MAG: hypothetical protein LBC93_01700 [Synergistaceae bacterium]|jgi:hypothetical protein|nr:hypothetical protein [Synergistaceae bacterium]